MTPSPTPRPSQHTGVRVDLFVALDRLERRIETWPGRRQGIVLDVVTETYYRPRRRWSLERHALAADLPAEGHLHQEYDVPLVLVYRHKHFVSPPVLMPWRETEDGTTEAARGTVSGGLITGDILAIATGAWPKFAGRMFPVYDRPGVDGHKWTPITDPA